MRQPNLSMMTPRIPSLALEPAPEQKKTKEKTKKPKTKEKIFFLNIKKMNTDEYIVVCRSYDRSDKICSLTYHVLEENHLTENLYIFVANESEKIKYEKALFGKQYKAIIVGVLGLNEVTNFICDYFPPEQRLFFIDDDVSAFYFFDESRKLIRRATNLKQVLDDAFETIDLYSLGAFGFYNSTNKLYLQKKPFKEFGPHFLGGMMWGARNNKSLICDSDSGGMDDFTRSFRYWDAHGGILLYWWCGYSTEKVNKLSGGLQSTGERELENTRKRAIHLLNNPSIQKFCEKEIFLDRFNKYSLQLIKPRKRREIILTNNPTSQFLKWEKWFQKKSDTL